MMDYKLNLEKALLESGAFFGIMDDEECRKWQL